MIIGAQASAKPQTAGKPHLTFPTRLPPNYSRRVAVAFHEKGSVNGCVQRELQTFSLEDR